MNPLPPWSVILKISIGLSDSFYISIEKRAWVYLKSACFSFSFLLFSVRPCALHWHLFFLFVWMMIEGINYVIVPVCRHTSRPADIHRQVMITIQLKSNKGSGR